MKVYQVGDLRVCVNGQSWTYHPECVTAVEMDQDVNVTVEAEASSQPQPQDPSGESGESSGGRERGRCLGSSNILENISCSEKIKHLTEQ